MSRLIGLGGKLRAGKDAVGDYLEEKHDFVKLGMSDALNDALLKLNPYIPTERIYADGEWVAVLVGHYSDGRRVTRVIGNDTDDAEPMLPSVL